MIKYFIVIFLFSAVRNLSALLLPPLFSCKDVSFFLHTREAPNVDVNEMVSVYNLRSLINSTFNATKNTKFITHGFTSSGNAQWIKDMAAALIQYEDCNVLRVDWGIGANDPFFTARANTEVVGKEIAFFIKTLKEKFNFDLKQGYCIGHSLGSYVCSFAGQNIDKLGHITGLDPAIDILQYGKDENKLDPSDALFVDVIHTDIRRLLILPSLGDPDLLGNVDIYPNDGHDQPGCGPLSDLDLIPPNVLEENPSNLDENFLACSHQRAYRYYIEASQNPSCLWVAYECPNYELFQKGECDTCGDDSSKCVLLGPAAELYTNKSRDKVSFFIKTAGEPPFCVQHYVVRIFTSLIDQEGLRSGGNLTFEVIGDTGKFSGMFIIKASDQGQIQKSLFVDPVDVGKISSVKLTWESEILLLGLFPIPTHYTLGVIALKVSPLSHYPEIERAKREVVACLTTDGSPTPVNDGTTVDFPAMSNCVI